MHNNVMRLASAVKIRPDAETARLHLSVDEKVEAWVRDMEHAHKVSQASVVEVALLRLMREGDERVGEILKRAGARRRRK